jgi:leucyl/phenylalanyl-tRNA---protein transferase
MSEEESEHRVNELTPDLLLGAYSQGFFPMADPDEEDQIFWYAPHPRALLPLDDRFRVSRNLRKLVRRGTFAVTVDRVFDEVLQSCAESAPDRPSTWISGEIIDAYRELFELGYAHSVECWSGPRLAGGLYGVALGGAFFGESMFHRETDASKVALVHLVDRLRAGGFTLLDVQFTTPHLVRFGAYEVSRVRYERLLAAALAENGDWHEIDRDESSGPSSGMTPTSA